GSATKRVVEEFQKANGLIIDGIAGNQTLSKIEELLKIPKEIIDETPYNISFNRALDIQMKQLNLTDSYRSSNAYIHKDYLRFIGSAQITSNTATIRSSSSTASNKIDTVKKGATVII